MKLLLLLFILCSCSHYQASSISNNRMIVTKNGSFGIFWWSDVLTCKTNDDGIIVDCIENDITNKSKFFE